MITTIKNNLIFQKIILVALLLGFIRIEGTHCNRIIKRLFGVSIGQKEHEDHTHEDHDHDIIIKCKTMKLYKNTVQSMFFNEDAGRVLLNKNPEVFTIDKIRKFLLIIERKIPPLSCLLRYFHTTISTAQDLPQ